MKTVTVDEVRANLPELLQLVARGKRVVITDGGKWVGQLAPPPQSPEEDAAAEVERQAKLRDFFRWIVQQREKDGFPVPQDDPLREFLTSGGEA